MEAETPRRSLREKQRQERAELILKAAEEVLVEKGYHEMSMEEVALKVGIAKGTVYLHFASKEDLVFALFERELATSLKVIDKILASTATARDKLERILIELYKGFLGKRIQLLVALYTGLEGQKVLAAKHERVAGFWKQLSARITSLLEEGKAAGEITSAIPIPVLRSTFFSLLSPRGFKQLIVEEQMTPDEVASYLARIYFQGVSAT
ncbi:TetR/AcrR family transcriptional regulator [Ktedonosporobacter rubrisoli]|uniref:TetR/AcrR family transcriptional regulator n=1 Tax=Ktedonosporobacter rubrisoli TaxID=2509675 RepID=A0A4P6JVQ0_KTERU|nr:TetR/AcrR family transcriptional regulator [Ktedonosporobacter rubrisoli]QBD79614.1 TetR/AcrR family transcriptional regulator [Ktedonosporobacter rubrisoli]